MSCFCVGHLGGKGWIHFYDITTWASFNTLWPSIILIGYLLHGGMFLMTCYNPYQSLFNSVGCTYIIPEKSFHKSSGPLGRCVHFHSENSHKGHGGHIAVHVGLPKEFRPANLPLDSRIFKRRVDMGPKWLVENGWKWRFMSCFYIVPVSASLINISFQPINWSF